MTSFNVRTHHSVSLHAISLSRIGYDECHTSHALTLMIYVSRRGWNGALKVLHWTVTYFVIRTSAVGLVLADKIMQIVGRRQVSNQISHSNLFREVTYLNHLAKSQIPIFSQIPNLSSQISNLLLCVNEFSIRSLHRDNMWYTYFKHNHARHTS